MHALSFDVTEYPVVNPFTETRRKILAFIRDTGHSVTVTEAHEGTGLAMGTLSHEIRELERAGFLTGEKVGRRKLVSLTGWPITIQ